MCSGREDLTPPEVLAYRQNGGARIRRTGIRGSYRTSSLRCTSRAGSIAKGEGIFDRMNDIGAHEVIVETPDHGKTLASMSEPEIERVLDLKLPKLSKMAGFEWATGLYINPMSPEEATRVLRAAQVWPVRRIGVFYAVSGFCRACREFSRRGRLQSDRRTGLKVHPAVWYFRRSGGNNSVVECDLAKVEVAGSNPVSRSNFFCPRMSRRFEGLPTPVVRSDRRRRQVVRQRSAKPPPPVQIRAAPPIFSRKTIDRHRLPQ